MAKDVVMSQSSRRHRVSPVAWRNFRNGVLFASPFIVGMLFFTVYPVVASLFYSLTDYDILSPPKWVGLTNYQAMFVHDDLFWLSLYNTGFYAVFHVPLALVFGISMALLLNANVRGISFYRTIYYLPTLVPLVASSILWIWILEPQFGLVNTFLEYVGVQGPGWLTDPVWSKPALIMMGMWGVGGAVIIYLAGLQDVPQHLREAAMLDGASYLQITVFITIPLLTPVILFNLIIGVIGAFQYFTQAYVMTHGGPAESTLFYSMYLYDQAFKFFHMGYASAMAWILFLIVLGCTLLIFRSAARWVYYGGSHE